MSLHHSLHLIFCSTLVLALNAPLSHASDLPARVMGKAATTAKSGVLVAMRGRSDLAASAIRLAPLSSRAPLRAAGTIPAKALQVGTMRDVAAEAEAAPAATLQWTQLTGRGGWVARVSLASPGAGALRLGIKLSNADAGEVRVSSASGQDVQGPIAGADVAEATRAYGMYWTPVTNGDAQVVELWIPEGTDRTRIVLEIESASHLASRPATLAKAGGTAAQGCHEDVVCVAASNPAIARASRSVAKIVFTKNGTSYMCTGTLINDGSSGQVPYLYTAAHCIDSQAIASTVNTFWTFEAAQCGGSTPTAFRQLSGGATLLYADAASDVALLRLADRAPDGAWFSGWDAEPVRDGANVVALHHPMGDLKKLSLGDAMPSALQQFITAGFRIGATEQGSSGSGLFTESNGEYLLRGGLKGGSSSCTSSGNLADPSNRDYYSRLDRALPTLRKWLSAAPSPAEDFTGMWFDPAEPGWGIGLVQALDGKAFLTWYSYDSAGKPVWLVVPEVKWSSAVALEGPLYRTTGTSYDAPYVAGRFSVAAVGTLRVEFARGTATLTVTVDGRVISKPLARMS